MRAANHNVDFTDDGDVVLCHSRGAGVYSGRTLELLRAWPWPSGTRSVNAIQAHRGLLYVLCTMADNKHAVYVYE